METVTPAESEKLLDGEELLTALFSSKEKRPSARWLYDQVRLKAIPYIRMGRLIYFDLKDVRQAIRERHTVNPRR